MNGEVKQRPDARPFRLPTRSRNRLPQNHPLHRTATLHLGGCGTDSFVLPALFPSLVPSLNKLNSLLGPLRHEGSPALGFVEA